MRFSGSCALAARGGICRMMCRPGRRSTSRRRGGFARETGQQDPHGLDTLGYLLALHATPANEQERAQVGRLAVGLAHEIDVHDKLESTLTLGGCEECRRTHATAGFT